MNDVGDVNDASRTSDASEADGRRSRLRAELADAARAIAPQWPLSSWVAVNPLLGLVPRGFHQAIAEAARWQHLQGYPDRAVLERALEEGLVDEEDVQVSATALGEPAMAARLLRGPAEGRTSRPQPPPLGDADEAVAGWLPRLVLDTTAGAPGPYARWRADAPHDRRLRRRAGRRGATLLTDLPERADDAVLAALDALGVHPAEWSATLRSRLVRLSGWAGYARWSDEWSTERDPSPRLPLVDLVALQLTCERLLGSPAPPTAERVHASTDDADRAQGRLVLTSLERGYRRRLLASLSSPTAPRPEGAPPASQVVCCIDVRSEGLRRHLEAVGPHQTLGFAGFFAVPMRHRPLGSLATVASAPVLVRPEAEVAEQPRPGYEQLGERYVRGQRALAGTSAVADGLAHGPLTMFPTAEAAGWALGPTALLRTVRPRLPGRRGPDAPPTSMLVDGAGTAGEAGFSLDERAFVAETALRSMGLTRDLAPLVVFCGHGATSTANAHAAALDCGACGGNPGGPNARALAAILNDHEVRSTLAERGIAIPAETWFLAAQHDTTLDAVEVFDVELAPSSMRQAIQSLADDLDRAAAANADARIEQLAASTPAASEGRGGREARRRAADWAQTRPEWGLVRNAAFIVAPRSLTAGVDLGGRAFLHSYEPDDDEDGKVLETILTAPMVVAQWINAQYYFSSVDPHRFGAGDKTLHNPLADLGVLEGAGGDLRVGLPWQSVADERGLRHVPVRLLALVQAPRARIDAVVARNPVLSDLFDGEWVHLVAGTGPGDWMRWQPDGWTEPIDAPLPQEAAHGDG